VLAQVKASLFLPRLEEEEPPERQGRWVESSEAEKVVAVASVPVGKLEFVGA